MSTNDDKIFTLSELAKAALEHHFGETNRPTLRVFLSFWAESGPRLEVAPDAPAFTDSDFSIEGWHFVINTNLLHQASPITVDFGPEGFCIQSSLDFTAAGGNCGGACDSH